MRTISLSLLPLVLCIPASLAAQSDGAVAQAVHSITPQDIAQRIGVLAHDSMRGRSTPSPELETAAHYIGEEFLRFGLKPGGDDGTFIQWYAIRRVQRTVEVSWAGGPTWESGSDVVHFRGGAADVSAAAIILAGAGAPTDPSVLEGTVVWYLPPDFSRQSRRTISTIARHSPAAIIVAADVPERTWNFLANRQRRGQSERGWEEAAAGAPILLVTETTAREALSAHGVDLTALTTAGSDAPVVRELSDLEVSVTVTERVLDEYKAPNTVGILEGSDPSLKHEYLVYSAHMDHVGVGRPVNGDSIYNGADDDASGTTGVIELAEAFAGLNPRPKRSMIFLTVSGEERGLWGSDFFASSPPVPIDQIVANLNIDMIGRNWTDTVVVIGKEHSDLGATLNAVNQRHPELNMTAIDDIWPQENFYFRSDHYNFARRGIPVLFFFTGTHEDYHRPSDHVEKIDAEKESRIVKLIFYLGLEIANAGTKPQWNPDSYERIVTGGGR